MRNGRRESNTSKEVCGQAVRPCDRATVRPCDRATVRPCEGGIVVDGEFGRPFRWKRSAPLWGVSDRAQSKLGVARFSTKSAASLALYAGEKRGGLDA
ncbi:MAG: hypothetical protein ACXW1E_08400 [Halobacteriota archaeon]